MKSRIIKRLGATIAAIVTILFAISMKANAEELPVLTWERGQVQNIVLGQDLSSEPWEIYLKSTKGVILKSSKSLTNNDNFLVYSFVIPDYFPIEGYVIEAQDLNGNIKQVAGVQIVEKISSEITRVPFELFLLLLGISIFFYLLIFSKNRQVKINLFSNDDPSNNKNLNILQQKLYFQIQKNNRQSLFKALLLEELKIDFKFAKLLNFIGIFGISIIIFLQFSKENWILGNVALVVLVLFIGNLSISYGLVAMSLSLFFSILNISLTKTFAEVLAFLVISSFFLAPNLYNQFLFKVLSSQVSQKMEAIKVSLISALISALGAYQILLLHESLTQAIIFLGISKEVLAFSLLIFFIFKNLMFLSRQLNFEEFEIFRAIGPLSSFFAASFIGAITYIWTTNQILFLTSVIASFFILSTSWIRLDFSMNSRLRQPSLFFSFALIFAITLSIYLATTALPLDVINSSHLYILLIFPLDLLFALYLLISKPTTQRADSA